MGREPKKPPAANGNGKAKHQPRYELTATQKCAEIAAAHREEAERRRAMRQGLQHLSR